MPSASPHQPAPYDFSVAPAAPPYSGQDHGQAHGMQMGVPGQVINPAAGQYSGPASGPVMIGQGSGPMGAASAPTMMHSGELQQLPPQFSHLGQAGSYQQQSDGMPMPGANGGRGAVMMYPQGQQPYPMGGYPMMQPGAFPQGMPAPTATGRLRALEVDEIPSHYRIKREGPRWFVLLGIALTAVATAASVTFLVLRANSQQAIASAALRLESFPPGAVVYVDNQRLADPTPVVYRQVKPSGRYKIRLELAKHKPYSQEVSIASAGGEIAITPTLMPLTGRVRVLSEPPGADVFINSLPRGKTPLTVSDLDMDNTKVIELRHPRCDPFRQELAWTDAGTIDLNIKLTPVAARPRAPGSTERD
jgi:hypothetical protein